MCRFVSLYDAPAPNADEIVEEVNGSADGTRQLRQIPASTMVRTVACESLRSWGLGLRQRTLPMGRQQRGRLNGAIHRGFVRRLARFQGPRNGTWMDDDRLGHDSRLDVRAMLGSSIDQVLLGQHGLGELRVRNRARGAMGNLRAPRALPPATHGPGFEAELEASSAETAPAFTGLVKQPKGTAALVTRYSAPSSPQRATAFFRSTKSATVSARATSLRLSVPSRALIRF